MRKLSDRPSFYFFILSGLLLVCLKAHGQGACFTFLGDSVGCAPFTVTVRSCASSSAITSFNFNYTPAWVDTDYVRLPPNQTDISYTYTQPGTYIIDQARGLNENLKRTVRVFNKTDKPIFEWSTCKDTLKINFKDLIFSSYTFDPGDGTTPLLISDRGKPFKYKYNYAGDVATFTFSIQGKQPETCDKTLISNTVTLYKTNQAPLADSLIGIDTATYRSIIQIRADEPFSFEFLDNLAWLSTSQDINDVDNPAKENTHSIPSVKQKSQFRTLTTSGCGNSVPAPEWTLFWVKTQSDNQKISLSWPKVNIPLLQEMKLLRNGILLLDLTGKSDTSLVDSTNLLCGETYCYQILTRLSVPNYAGMLVFISAPICAKAISTRPPDAVSNLTATVTDSGIELTGKGSPLAKTFELFRKERESENAFEKIREAENLPVLDTSALFNTKAYCYKISYRDVCGNQSYQSDTVCPILLTLNTVGETTKNFSWTSFEGWKGDVEGYELIRTPPSDAPLILDMENRLSYKSTERDPIRQKIQYQIKARASNSILYPEGSYSNNVENIQNSKLKFPEVFTPNNDGFNDSFRCYSLFATNYELRIYNAWGNIIFASQTITDGWSGNINSKPAPSGPYAYWATGTDQEGNVIETKGFFTLAR